MEDNRDIVLDNDRLEKVSTFIRNNMHYLIIGLISFIYILYSLVTIDKSGKSVIQIVSEGLIALAMGVSITSILSFKGLSAGMQSKQYLKSQNDYDKQINIANDKIDRLEEWCENKTKRIIKRKQTMILTRACLSYESFTNRKYLDMELTKEQKKAIRKSYNVKVYGLTADELVSDCTENEATDKPYETLNSYKARRFKRTLLTKIIFALIFGYYTVKMITDPNLANVIWHAFQIALWIALGFMEYMNSCSFITGTYSNQLKRKKRYLEEFNNEVSFH